MIRCFYELITLVLGVKTSLAGTCTGERHWWPSARERPKNSPKRSKAMTRSTAASWAAVGGFYCSRGAALIDPGLPRQSVTGLSTGMIHQASNARLAMPPCAPARVLLTIARDGRVSYFFRSGADAGRTPSAYIPCGRMTRRLLRPHRQRPVPVKEALTPAEKVELEPSMTHAQSWLLGGTDFLPSNTGLKRRATITVRQPAVCCSTHEALFAGAGRQLFFFPLPEPLVPHKCSTTRRISGLRRSSCDHVCAPTDPPASVKCAAAAFTSA